MARFRIRFLLQEIDLAPGEWKVGRAASCQLTLDDPLVSREHAKIVVREELATIEDLSSRNGVRVNGRVVEGVHELSDGDRIRIGTQQIVWRSFREREEKDRSSTGFMIHCARCGLPFSTEAVSCPNCGHGKKDELFEDVENETTSTSQNAWNLELLVETIRRAQDLGRNQEIEKLLVRAREEVQLASEPMDRRRLDQLADAAVRFGVDCKRLEWAQWALALYAQYGMVPRPEVGKRLSILPETERSSLIPMVQKVVDSLPPTLSRDGVDRMTIQALQELVQGVGVSR